MSRNPLRRAAAGWFDAAVLWLKKLARYGLPLLAWMALIFVGSADTESGPRGSRILGPLLHWLAPGLAPATAEEIIYAARKCAHLSEFAVLGILAWRAIRRPIRSDKRPWQWPEAGWALLLSAAYAISDELHQSFVPTRVGSGWDVLLDTGGAIFGLLALWGWGRWRGRW